MANIALSIVAIIVFVITCNISIPFRRIISENIELPNNYFPILIENSEDEGEGMKSTTDVKMLKIAPMLIKVCICVPFRAGMYRVFIVIFLNSASSAAAPVFDLLLCTHTDNEEKPR